MKRLLLIAVAFLALAALAPAALAGGSTNGASAYTFTYVVKNETIVQPNFTNPCTGTVGTITINFNSVFHITQLTSGQGAGTFWATGTETGTLTLVPNDSTQPTYTGHFTAWFGDNNNLQNGTETSTLNMQLVGTDGSSYHVHDVAHLSVSATGVTVSFDKFSCG